MECSAVVPIETRLPVIPLPYHDEKTAKTKRQTVRSEAQLRYSAVTIPTNLDLLMQNLNLGVAPDNWLRSRNDYEQALQRSVKDTVKAGSDPLTDSFAMAHKNLECLDDVDVVSDSRNVKKLLKLPFQADKHVSMIVHRVGKSLLLDDFNLYSYLISKERDEWRWMRKFFFEQVIRKSEENSALVLYKPQNSRAALREKDMYSKLLYYNTPPEQEDADVPVLKQNPVISSPPKPAEPDEPKDIPSAAFEANIPAGDFSRTVVWKFENTEMLIGSNLPVFSHGSHPCVSLRLNNMAEPINVLTGLDCWLDNLMCNVPEVAMCYHTEGIIQKFEVLKTADIPHIESCEFSPTVVYEVAQHILSFLKYNAAKEGHTYWLFKEADSEVIKLYDLTTLCPEIQNNAATNPFSAPLAVLMCQLAQRLIETATSNAAKARVVQLLQTSLRLIDAENTPWLFSLVNYLLYSVEGISFVAGKPGPLDGTAASKNMELTRLHRSRAQSKKVFSYLAKGLSKCIVTTPKEGETEDVASSNSASSRLRFNALSWHPSQEKKLNSHLFQGALVSLLHLAQMANNEFLDEQCQKCLFSAHLCWKAWVNVRDLEKQDDNLRGALMLLAGNNLVGLADPESSAASRAGLTESTEQYCLRADMEIICDAANRFSSPHEHDYIFAGSSDRLELFEKAIVAFEIALQDASEAFGADSKSKVIKTNLAATHHAAASLILEQTLASVNMDQKVETEKADEYYNSCFKHLEYSLEGFQLLKDMKNLVIVLSTCARLCRFVAHITAGQLHITYLSKALDFYDMSWPYYERAVDHEELYNSELFGSLAWDQSSVYAQILESQVFKLESDKDTLDAKMVRSMADGIAIYAAKGIDLVTMSRKQFAHSPIECDARMAKFHHYQAKSMACVFDIDIFRNKNYKPKKRRADMLKYYDFITSHYHTAATIMLRLSNEQETSKLLWDYGRFLCSDNTVEKEVVRAVITILEYSKTTETVANAWHLLSHVKVLFMRLLQHHPTSATRCTVRESLEKSIRLVASAPNFIQAFRTMCKDFIASAAHIVK